MPASIKAVLCIKANFKRGKSHEHPGMPALALHDNMLAPVCTTSMLVRSHVVTEFGSISVLKEVRAEVQTRVCLP